MFITSLLKSKSCKASTWIQVFRLATVTCLTVTFIVVLVYLAPTYDGEENGFVWMFIDGTSKYFHLLCPLSAIVSFIFFEDNSDIKLPYTVWGVVPTILYAIIAVILNAKRIWYGPYGFLHVYEQSVMASVIWLGGIIVAAYLFALLIRFLSGIKNRK